MEYFLERKVTNVQSGGHGLSALMRVQMGMSVLLILGV